MPVLERLTYLIGVCAAIVGWSVSQLSGTLAASKVIAYDVSAASEAKANVLTTLELRNVSRTVNAGRVEISFDGHNASTCDLDFEILPLGVSPLGDAPPVTNVGPDGKKRSIVAVLDNLTPGSASKFSVRHPSSCPVSAHVKTEDSGVRLLKTGIESSIIENQFLILVSLMAVFSAVFALTYVVSLFAAKEKP